MRINSEKLLFRSGVRLELDFLEIRLNRDTGGIQDGVYVRVYPHLPYPDLNGYRKHHIGLARSYSIFGIRVCLSLRVLFISL